MQHQRQKPLVEMPEFSTRRTGKRIDFMVQKPDATRRQRIDLGTDLYYLLKDYGFDIDDIEYAYKRIGNILYMLILQADRKP